MHKLEQTFLLGFILLADLLIFTTAVPLTSKAANSPVPNDIASDDYDDVDDTEVIEMPTNDIDDDATDHIIDLSFFGNAIFGMPDDSNAALIANYSANVTSVNPEELGSYLEGDILVPRPTATGPTTKNGITSQSQRWPGGIVPFEVRGQYNAQDLATIQHAMDEYHRLTCIRFVPRTSERDYVSIVSGNTGCWSSVGRIGGKQEVNLQSPGCLTKPGTAMHELMHALGFLHEQNRHERDSYVAIQYQNVQQHAVSNFEKAALTNAFGVPYDYGSVMHYSANAFSNNGRPTIVALQPGGSARMGQRDGFSAFDIEKLNKMYNCGYGASSSAAAPAPAPVAAPAPAPVPVPVPAPAPVPAPVPAPAPAPGTTGAAPNNVIGSFLGGLISGLGLGR